MGKRKGSSKNPPRMLQGVMLECLCTTLVSLERITVLQFA